MSHYTQILTRTNRPTQILSTLTGMDVYLFPYTPAGTLVCERTSEAMDVRIIVQVAKGISWSFGHGCPVLAIAGDEGTGFWCGLFDGGVLRFEQNRLTGPRNFAEKSATPAEVDVLCGYFGPGVNREVVYGILSQPMRALDRHASLAQALGFPSWSAGVGYSRIVEGRVPPEAGTPKRPPRSLRELRPLEELPKDAEVTDPVVWFHRVCGRAFRFLEEDFGFRKEPSRYSVSQDSKFFGNAMVIGPGHLRLGYKNDFMLGYSSPHLIVVIEGVSYGAATQLCLLDRNGFFLHLADLVERRDPELLDLCRLACNQSEQIPIFAETLRKCASDVLAGDLSAISRSERRQLFPLRGFSSPTDGDLILSLYGPRGRLRTIRATFRRIASFYKTRAKFYVKRRSWRAWAFGFFPLILVFTLAVIVVVLGFEKGGFWAELVPIILGGLVPFVAVALIFGVRWAWSKIAQRNTDL